MSVIDFGPFSGTIPRIGPLFLPPDAAQLAENTKLFSGEIRPFGGPRTIVATPFFGANIKTIYRYVNGGTGHFFNWDKRVHVVRGALAKDTLNRVYYTGDGTPKKTGSDIGPPDTESSQAPKDWYHLGVRIPGKAPALAIQAAGAGLDETRQYVVTYNTGWGEESAPSDPAQIVCKPNATIRATRPHVAVGFLPAAVNLATDQINVPGHKLDPLGKLQFANTGGGLPAPLAVLTDYYTIAVDANNFKVATSRANAAAGIAIDLTTQGTGNHSYTQYGPDPKYNIVSWNLYRTLTGSQSTKYALVAKDLPFGTTFYDDSLLAAALGVPLETLDFDEPPDDLEGLTVMPGQFLAAFSPSLKQVLFSKPGFPYAWPELADYRRTLAYNPLACGAVGTVLVVGTDGKPSIFTGEDPTSISEDALDAEQAVVSKEAFRETPLGVAWASPDGIYLVSAAGGQLVTRELLTKEEWLALRPVTMAFAVYDGRLYIRFDRGAGGNWDVAVFDPNEPKAAFTTLDIDAAVLYPEILSDELYMVVAGQIVAWDSDPLLPRTWRYRTKRVRERRPSNKAVLEIVSDFGGGVLASGQTLASYNQAIADIQAANAALQASVQLHAAVAGAIPAGWYPLAGDGLTDVPPSLVQDVTVELYGDQVLRHTVTISAAKPIVRLPGKYLANEWDLKLSAACQVRKARLADSVDELKEG